jgi:hypothetical protein
MVANTREGVGLRPVGRRTEPVSGGCCARRAGATSSQFGESCCIWLRGDIRWGGSGLGRCYVLAIWRIVLHLVAGRYIGATHERLRCWHGGGSRIGQTKPNVLIMPALIRLTGWSPIPGRASASDRSAAARSRFRAACAQDGRVQRPRNPANHVAAGCIWIQGPPG